MLNCLSVCARHPAPHLTMSEYRCESLIAPADLFSRNAPGVAWKSKPTWYIVVNNDRSAGSATLPDEAYRCNHPRCRQQPRPDAVPPQLAIHLIPPPTKP